MTAIIPLGRFDKIRLREAWPSEDGHFTPWLARPENLKLLGEALGFGELQDQQTEVRVGDFRIDILAVDGDGERVIIENQLEQTDHSHLGQLMTYLAGQQGKGSIVWIAQDFRPEHRAAIDWLNRNTVDDFAFFGVELELWRIDNSPPAPRFKIVAQPNQWTNSLREATPETADPELAERHRIRLAIGSHSPIFLESKTRRSQFGVRSKTACTAFLWTRPGIGSWPASVYKPARQRRPIHFARSRKVEIPRAPYSESGYRSGIWRTPSLGREAWSQAFANFGGAPPLSEAG
jgi:hypothetical protein